MRIFIAKEDIILFGLTIVKKEQMIKFLDGEPTHIINVGSTTIQVSLEQLTNDSRFQEVKLLPLEEKKELNFIIDEIPDEEDLEVKRFRIQLDVMTNRKKLREIENFMRKTLEKML